MKKINLFFVAILFLCVSCDVPGPVGPEQIECIADFEDVKLPLEGFVFEGGHKIENLEFNNSYAGTSLTGGFAISRLTDTKENAMSNAFSTYAGKAASGKQFAVALNGIGEIPTISVEKGTAKFKSLKVCNSSWAALRIKEGSAYTRAFADGDWFRLLITGYTYDETPTDSVEFFLADYRNGKTEVIDEWKSVDLSSLGECSYLRFTLTSSDPNEYNGYNTPTYVAIDDVEYTFIPKKK